MKKILITGDIASTIFTITVSEGLVRQLDPNFDLAKHAVEYLMQYSLGSAHLLTSDPAHIFGLTFIF